MTPGDGDPAPARPGISRLAARYAAAPPSRFAAALDAARRDAASAAGRPLLDLTTGSPPSRWAPGLGDVLAAAHARHAAALRRPYAPDPLGLPRLREAVAAWYRAAGCDDVVAARVAIAPGTSTAYDWLFRLLLDPGGAARVIGPTPTYPLLDELATLAGVGAGTFPLASGDGPAAWRYDAARLERHLRGDERVLALVSPHNPTGAVIDDAGWEALAGVARRHDLVPVCDEVFSPFVRPGATLPRAHADAFPLAFLLHGTSKLFGLPALKVGWIVARGADAGAVGDAMAALAHIADAYLAVPDVTQEIAADLVEALVAPGGALRGAPAAMAAAAASARAALVEGLGDLGGAGEVLAAPAGVYVVARLAAPGLEEEEAALALLAEGLVVHPGFFYGLAGDHLVATCCAGDAGRLREAGVRIAATLARLAALAPPAGGAPCGAEPA